MRHRGAIDLEICPLVEGRAAAEDGCHDSSGLRCWEQTKAKIELEPSR